MKQRPKEISVFQEIARRDRTRGRGPLRNTLWSCTKAIRPVRRGVSREFTECVASRCGGFRETSFRVGLSSVGKLLPLLSVELGPIIIRTLELAMNANGLKSSADEWNSARKDLSTNSF